MKVDMSVRFGLFITVLKFFHLRLFIMHFSPVKFSSQVLVALYFEFHEGYNLAVALVNVNFEHTRGVIENPKFFTSTNFHLVVSAFRFSTKPSRLQP